MRCHHDQIHIPWTRRSTADRVLRIHVIITIDPAGLLPRNPNDTPPIQRPHKVILPHLTVDRVGVHHLKSSATLLIQHPRKITRHHLTTDNLRLNTLLPVKTPHPLNRNLNPGVPRRLPHRANRRVR